eukprot:2038346-Prorocentrum_lima.AAC.1
MELNSVPQGWAPVMASTEHHSAPNSAKTMAETTAKQMAPRMVQLKAARSEVPSGATKGSG